MLKLAFREPITSASEIPPQLWGVRCSLPRTVSFSVSAQSRFRRSDGFVLQPLIGVAEGQS